MSRIAASGGGDAMAWEFISRETATNVKTYNVGVDSFDEYRLIPAGTASPADRITVNGIQSGYLYVETSTTSTSSADGWEAADGLRNVRAVTISTLESGDGVRFTAQVSPFDSGTSGILGGGLPDAGAVPITQITIHSVLDANIDFELFGRNRK
jgi:hypothetical protein